MIIRLTEQQFSYLNNELAKQQNDLRYQLIAKESKGAFVYIDVGEDYIDTVRDWMIDHQTLIGFDANYDLTPEGILLDDLIDLFYIK